MAGEWAEELPVAITVTDKSGKIIEMNDMSATTFAKYGGHKLMGTNIRDIHSEQAYRKIMKIVESQTANSYTIEKNGITKMVYQTLWYQNGKYAGLIEFSMVIPRGMPHFLRN